MTDSYWSGTRDIPKIDSEASDGLGGPEADSLAYRVEEIERHFHTEERWWGATAVPGEINAIDANVDRPFIAASGANAWGTAIPVLGSDDDPTPNTGVYFDPHRVVVVDFGGNATVWRFRFIWGEGTSGEAIAAAQWTEFMIINAAAGPFALGAPSPMKCPRISVGWKAWVQVWNVTNLDTLSFFWGAHGYRG